MDAVTSAAGSGERRRARLRADTTRICLIVSPHVAKGDWLDTLQRLRNVDMVQLRAKGQPDERIVAWAQRLRPHFALLILNDRPDLVQDAGADGAHVGQDDMDAVAARALLGPDAILGLSTHDEREVREARSLPVDYVGLGPCFETGSKELELAPGGAALVRRSLPAAGDLPVFPIGGITPANVASLAAAGARRVAVGSGILDAADPVRAAQAVAGALA